MSKGARHRQGRKEAAAAPVKKGDQVKKIASRVALYLFLFIVLAVFVFGVTYATGIFQHSLTALEVDGHKVNLAEFQVNYATSRADFLNNYASMLGIESAVGLDAQICTLDQTKTWGQYFQELAIEDLTDVMVLYSQSRKAGYSLEKEDPALYEEFKSSIDGLEQSASDYNMTLKEYLSAFYGSEVRKNDLREVFGMRYIAQGFYEYKRAQFDFNEDQIAAYYSENPDEFDVVDYRSFAFPYETVQYKEPVEGETVDPDAPKSEAEATEITNKNKEAAKALADAFFSRLTGEQSFIELAREYAVSDADKEKYAEDEGTVFRGAKIYRASGNIATWFSDAERKTGDTDVIDSGSGYTVVYFLDRYRPENKTVSVRHILFSFVTVGEDATDEEKAKAETLNKEAEETAARIYQEWQAGERTEELFKELALEHNSDPGSQANGGLYEEFSKNTMVEEFDAWAFDASRKTGDTGVVKTQFGYHVLYYVGDGRPEWMVTAESSLIDQHYNEFYEQARLEATVKVHQYALSISL